MASDIGAENTTYCVSKLDVVKNFQIPQPGTVTTAYMIGMLKLDAMPAVESI